MTNLLAAIDNPVIKDSIGKQSVIGAANTSKVIETFIVNFIRIGFVAGSVIFVFMLIWGSIEYIMAGGAKEKTGNAAKRITNALIGIALLFSVFAIVYLANKLFGIDLLMLLIPEIT